MTPVLTAAPLAKASILIVEDEGLIAHEIERRLRKAGYSVAGIVDSGEDALGKVTETGADLVLMDIRLRGEMDGIEAARQVQACHDIPIVYLTAHTDHETLERAKVSGPFGYLTKPVSTATLPAAIEIALYKHRVERQLRQQRAWLRTALQTIADGMIIAGPHGRIEYMNPACERLTGWGLDQAFDRPVSQVLRLYHPELCELDAFLHAGVLGEKISSFPAGVKLMTSANERISVEGDISPITDEGGSLGAVITFRDTTDRDEHEREFRQEQKMRAVGRLAAGIAHDFNNLLTVILGHAGLLLGGKGQLAGSARQALEEIEKAGTTAAALTKQLLAFSRHRVNEPHMITLNAVVKNNESLCRSLLGADIRWRATLCADAKTVYADPGQLAQVLMNLVVNASDAMPAGGTLTVTTGNVGTDDPRAEANGGYATLSVADTGPGIAAGAADHIFEPFFTTKPTGCGTGLGLSIVHAIVSGLGGRISVDSKPGAGTTFQVLLPVAAQGPGAPESEPAPRAVSAAGAGTILLVDDDDAVRGFIGRCLENSGYRILEAADGNQALAVAAAHGGNIDVLVTDIVMPGMGGLRLAEQLTRTRRNVRTLFVSGYAGGEDAERDLPEGALFLRKPFRPDDLLAHVERLMENPSDQKVM